MLIVALTATTGYAKGAEEIWIHAQLSRPE